MVALGHQSWVANATNLSTKKHGPWQHGFAVQEGLAVWLCKDNKSSHSSASHSKEVSIFTYLTLACLLANHKGGGNVNICSKTFPLQYLHLVHKQQLARGQTREAGDGCLPCCDG
jgi:hypothetical protein